MQFWHRIYILAVDGTFAVGYQKGCRRGLRTGWQRCVSICEAVQWEGPGWEDTGDCWRRTILTQRLRMEAETRNAALSALQIHRALPKIIKNIAETDKLFRKLICLFLPLLHGLNAIVLWQFSLSSHIQPFGASRHAIFQLYLLSNLVLRQDQI